MTQSQFTFYQMIAAHDDEYSPEAMQLALNIVEACNAADEAADHSEEATGKKVSVKLVSAKIDKSLLRKAAEYADAITEGKVESWPDEKGVELTVYAFRRCIHGSNKAALDVFRKRCALFCNASFHMYG